MTISRKKSLATHIFFYIDFQSDRRTTYRIKKKALVPKFRSLPLIPLSGVLMTLEYPKGGYMFHWEIESQEGGITPFLN